VYLDDANLTFLPARTVFSAGGALQFFEQHMTLAARVRNLFDVRAQDLLSRPLPGFQFLLSLAVEEAIP
jgi:outer membrane receptor protein involved in Fe transport